MVFRVKDPNNYYIVRANALENNYRLYHVVNGRRSQFAGANLKVTSGEWHELRVEVVGNKITCYYDGSQKIEAADETFKAAGKVGLWTKSGFCHLVRRSEGSREMIPAICSASVMSITCSNDSYAATRNQTSLAVAGVQLDEKGSQP